MKRLSLFSFTLFCLLLCSWGYKGHKTVALIAERHLTPKAAFFASTTLQNQKIDAIASWADEVRSEPGYRHTASWHFLNLPLGLDFPAFPQAVKSQAQPNVYTAILSCQATLEDTTGKYNRTQQEEALKFLVHLVGDAHQPMHVSRAEDKGGNTIRVTFDEKQTNLHSLWDSDLIDRENLTQAEMAAHYDQATPAEVKSWQSADPVRWLWESYQISSLLYQETDGDAPLGEAYYQAHIGIIRNRIEKAGIRLAGLLNHIAEERIKKGIEEPPFAASPESSIARTPDSTAELIEAPLDHIREYQHKTVITKGLVYGTKVMSNMILVDLGRPYPDELLTLVLKGPAKEHFAPIDLKGKTVRITGEVIDYHGKPEIVTTYPRDLTIVDP
jgi:hypothetical protein